MTVPQPTLAEFLLARIAEDEAAAFARGMDAMTGDRWKHLPEPDYNAIQTDWLAQSRRVLAEVEVQRRIVELHADGREELRYPGDDLDDEVAGMPAWCVRCTVEHEGEPWPCLTLRLLALPYADHPAHREEWAV